jgi:dihydrofolate reductase
VASRTLRRLNWHGATPLGADVPGEVRALKARYAGELQVHGSPGLLQTLLGSDLVDVLHLVVAPVALGAGKRLFGPGTAPAAFALEACRATPAGLVLQTYRRAGRPAYGNVGLEPQGG